MIVDKIYSGINKRYDTSIRGSHVVRILLIADINSDHAKKP